MKTLPETNLSKMLKNLSPTLNRGEYVFCTLKDVSSIDRKDTICEFKEAEGTTVIIEKQKADKYNLNCDYVVSWITLNVYSSLNNIGLTALFSTALAKHAISCNVVAGYYHDHIFIDAKDRHKAMEVLINLTKKSDF